MAIADQPRRLIPSDHRAGSPRYRRGDRTRCRRDRSTGLCRDLELLEALGLPIPPARIGRKHERSIRLDGWQCSVVVASPGDFVAGLTHSDGCRVLNRVKGHVYPRYFFSNLSADIRGLFVWACTLLGVESRAAGPRNVAVSRQASVAILDRIVGPKS